MLQQSSLSCFYVGKQSAQTVTSEPYILSIYCSIVILLTFISRIRSATYTSHSVHLRLDLFVAAQIDQTEQQKLFKCAGQLGQPGQE